MDWIDGTPLLPPPCTFDLDHYEYILRRALRLGYQSITHSSYVKNGVPERPFILLRHDIDLSLERALPLIRLERSLGLVSTIFVRVHAQGYNPFDLNNYALLRQYSDWGCEIALHYEPVFMQRTREDPLHVLQRAKAVLEAVLDKPVYGLVSHAPRLAPFIERLQTDEIRALGFLYDANEARFTSESLYLSDANRRWKKGCPCRHLGNNPRITLVVHPYWWYPMTDEEKHRTIEYIRQGA